MIVKTLTSTWYDEYCGKPVKDWLSLNGAASAFDDAVKRGHKPNPTKIILRELIKQEILQFNTSKEDGKRGIPDDPCKCASALACPRVLVKDFGWPTIIGVSVDYNDAYFLTEDLVIVRTLTNRLVQRENDTTGNAGLLEIQIKPVSLAKQAAIVRKKRRERRREKKLKMLAKNTSSKRASGAKSETRAMAEASGLGETVTVRQHERALPVREVEGSNAISKTRVTRSDNIRKRAKDVRELLR